MSWSEWMRRDWDERARQDALHYIASWRKAWDTESFLASGEEDYRRLVEPVLSRLSFDLRSCAVLELGCGAGRMTRSFAGRAARVYALDVSPEMLRRARDLLADQENIVWLQGDGTGLSGVPSGSVDLVFSYLMLQHLPNEALVLGYLREMLRVLVVGGVFLFQFNSASKAGMNWKGRLAWRVVDAVWSTGLHQVSRAVAAQLGLDPNIAGRSWRGARVNVGKVVAEIDAAGGEVRAVEGENMPMTWCWGIMKATGASSAVMREP